VTDSDTETPYRLAYQASTRALDDQARVLESIRTRAGTIFAATALVTSFLGGIALSEVRAASASEVIHWHPWSFTAAGIAFFVALAIVTLAILLPYRLRFSLSATEIIKILEERESAGDPVAAREAYRELALQQDEMYDDNARWVRALFWLFRGAILFLVLEVATWLVVLWRAKV
jgi:hypothetical protein